MRCDKVYLHVANVERSNLHLSIIQMGSDGLELSIKPYLRFGAFKFSEGFLS